MPPLVPRPGGEAAAKEPVEGVRGSVAVDEICPAARVLSGPDAEYLSNRDDTGGISSALTCAGFCGGSSSEPSLDGGAFSPGGSRKLDTSFLFHERSRASTRKVVRSCFYFNSNTLIAVPSPPLPDGSAPAPPIPADPSMISTPVTAGAVVPVL